MRWSWGQGSYLGLQQCQGLGRRVGRWIGWCECELCLTLVALMALGIGELKEPLVYGLAVHFVLRFCGFVVLSSMFLL